MIGFLTLAVIVQSAFAGNLVEVLQNDGETTLIALNILKYHVVKGSIHKADASNELQLETLAGTKIRFNIYSHNHAVTVEGSKITHFDLTASNGMVHVIDTVMMPPTGNIVDLVAGNSDLSTLLSLVKSAGLAGALQGDALTVFAPTNAEPNLEILEYHVVPHTEYSAGLYNREHLRTLDSHHDVIRLSARGEAVTVNRNAHVIQADISATNGVVHLIDHVLIPARYHLSSILG
ncbi:transforming growth factor-beta-induced protein ig-h3-like [Saccostrea cucullata]|uniref:transforming growth factor-beta-induced protein ig-h3-like n=1 Tax=Saccostrea cuccullata TaxID=36930 RepID=UPI002ED48B79